MQRFLAPIFVLLVLLVCATPAEAHANIVRSEPAAGSTLEAAPAEIMLEFSEELDPTFSRVRLFDSTNTVINEGPGTIDPQNPRITRLAPGVLAKGTYTAIWRVRSADDGHVTEGNVPFGIGVAVSDASSIPPPGTPEPATVPPPTGSSLVRWLNLVSAIVMLGALPFGLFVWRPAWIGEKGQERPRERETGRQGDREKRRIAGFRLSSSVVRPPETTDNQMGQALRSIMTIGGVALLVASVLFLIDQAATATGVSWAEALGAPLLQLLQSRSGSLLLARVALTVGIVALASRLPAPGAGARWPWWLGLGLGAALLATWSLNSHGAAEAQGAALATTIDWLHLAATTAWIGGLVPLAVALWIVRQNQEAAPPLRSLIPRFSVLAIVSVVTLAASGTYSYFLHVGSPRLLLDTTYGRALAFKLVLFALLMLFGAWNLLVLSPGLRRAKGGLLRSFRRTVAVELVLGACVLLAVGAMTSVAPSNSAWAEQEKLGQVRKANAAGVAMRLQVAPAQIGDNEFAVDIEDERAGAAEKQAKVLVRFDMQGMTMGEQQTELTGGENGRYLGRGSFLAMGGRWNVEVILRRAGFEDVRQQFVMDIVKSAQGE